MVVIRPTSVEQLASLSSDSLLMLWRNVLRLPRRIWWLARHVCWALGSGKSFFGWLRAFLIGAFPPIFWTLCFKQARKIPDSWRPPIHTWLLPPADDFLMSPLGVIFLTVCLLPVGCALFKSGGSAPLPQLRGVGEWEVSCSCGAIRAGPGRKGATGGGGQYSRANFEEEGIAAYPPPFRRSANSFGSTARTQEKVLVGLQPHAHPSSPSLSDRSRSASLSSSSTLEDCICDGILRPTDEDEELGNAGWPKLYALWVLCYPVALWLMNLAAFTEIRAYKDLMAWSTYGALHFASPIVCAWWLWFFAPPGAACAFGWCLGWQNVAGVITHLSFPNAAPWFYDLYGPSLHPIPPPDYTYPGNPAGLVRVDVLLGTKLYASGFKKSPVVFGAFPSLHAASAVICAYFVARYSRRKGLAFMTVYTYWMFWSTMYFHHHYAIDLIAGTVYASVSFLIALRHVLPRLEKRHEEECTTIGWDRVFLGGGFFGTSLGETWGSGHWTGELPQVGGGGTREAARR